MAKTNSKTKVGVVLPNRLNVREKPEGKAIGLLKSGSVVEIVSQKGEWLKIRYNNSTAWVVGEYIEKKEVSA